MDQLFALGHVYFGAQILAAVELIQPDNSRFDCSCQQTHDMPEVRPVRPKKRSALIKPSLLLELPATQRWALPLVSPLRFSQLTSARWASRP